MVYPFGGLLSLIPHLIKHLVWRCAGRGCGCGWVEHNCAAWFGQLVAPGGGRRA